jgi:hypothetical protein
MTDSRNPPAGGDRFRSNTSQTNALQADGSKPGTLHGTFDGRRA